MDKVTWMKKAFLWVGIVAAVIIAVIGLCFGQVIEGNLFEEVAKWIVVGIGVIGILECFVYIVGPYIYHDTHKDDGKGK